MSRTPQRSHMVVPMVMLGLVSVCIPFALFSVDHALFSDGFDSALDHYLSFDAEAVSNSIGVLSSITAAVLGIIITVASIIVQLAATRYTPVVTEMFFRDRYNRMVLALYVIGCVMGFWTAFGVNAGWVPRVSLLAMLIVATLAFVIMAPYFAYVFHILAPKTVVQRIRQDAEDIALVGARMSMDQRQGRVLELTEHLTDIAINSIAQRDKIIAIACVDALRDLSAAYLARKSELPDEWFQLTNSVRENPDFASMAVDSVTDLEQDRAWFEFKVLRQYQSIYTEALGNVRDINYVIAINTRKFAEHAIANDNKVALELTIKFFNTYLRATLNRNDVRTAYTILNQYRLMAEATMRAGLNDACAKIAKHLRYYGHVSYDKHLAFVTETVAYDVGKLCETAHEIGNSVEDDLLAVFLTVDSAHSEGDMQESSLRGVRKAQIKLATYYLTQNDRERARRIFDDMLEEKPERLRSLREELMAVKSKDFWEISDRGENFEYLEEDRRAQVSVFFGWFELRYSGAHKIVEG